ncbi:YciI family protein [Micromonospora sp. NPDC051006]|uniref:YciI family protein n=1 Tax=Micromonospora sp. NPDC051006 TaxID=3364283 RepID=UPI003792AB7F
MRYALLINERPGAYVGLSGDERAAITAEYMALRSDDRVIGGERLQPAGTATTARAGDGELLLTDGPFADTKEIFGGFYIVEAEDLDGALELAARIPVLRLGGSVEVRPLAEF